MGKNVKTRQRVTACAMSAVMLSSLVGILPQSTVNAQPQSDSISNGSLKAQIGDLGQISSLQIKNNRTNNSGSDLNFVLPNDTAAQNNEAHQWMGEMIFSYRTSKDGNFASDNSEFVERFPELSLFFKAYSPLDSEMICIFPYFCPYAESAREIREIFS